MRVAVHSHRRTGTGSGSRRSLRSALAEEKGPVGVWARGNGEVEIDLLEEREAGAGHQLQPHAFTQHAVMVWIGLVSAACVGRGHLDVQQPSWFQDPLELTQGEVGVDAVLK